eukprot:6469578-Amphidinium_carterae.1
MDSEDARQARSKQLQYRSTELYDNRVALRRKPELFIRNSKLLERPRKAKLRDIPGTCSEKVNSPEDRLSLLSTTIVQSYGLCAEQRCTSSDSSTAPAQRQMHSKLVSRQFEAKLLEPSLPARAIR